MRKIRAAHPRARVRYVVRAPPIVAAAGKIAELILAAGNIQPALVNNHPEKRALTRTIVNVTVPIPAAVRRPENAVVRAHREIVARPRPAAHHHYRAIKVHRAMPAHRKLRHRRPRLPTVQVARVRRPHNAAPGVARLRINGVAADKQHFVAARHAHRPKRHRGVVVLRVAPLVADIKLRLQCPHIPRQIRHRRHKAKLVHAVVVYDGRAEVRLPRVVGDCQQLVRPLRGINRHHAADNPEHARRDLMHAVVAGNGDRQILQHRRYRKHQSYRLGRVNALPSGAFAVQIVDDKSRRHPRPALRNAPQLRINGNGVAHPLFQHRHARSQIARQNRTARRR